MQIRSVEGVYTNFYFFPMAAALFRNEITTRDKSAVDLTRRLPLTALDDGHPPASIARSDSVVSVTDLCVTPLREARAPYQDLGVSCCLQSVTSLIAI
jgi:hypothetical protein